MVAGMVGRSIPAPRHLFGVFLRALQPPSNGKAHRQQKSRAQARLREATEQRWGVFAVISKSQLSRKWQLDPERRATADFRSKVYRTVVKLHNSESAGQPDAIAAGTRGEK